MMLVGRALLASVVLCSTSGCGSVNVITSDASAALDVPGPPRCNPLASFRTPVALTSLNTNANDERADLSPDELTMYFSSSRSGGVGSYDIYEATRASSDTGTSFGNIIPVSGVNTAGEDREPRVTIDGRSIFAVSRASGVPFYHITLATRTSTTLAFNGLQLVANVNGTTNDDDPYISPTGNVLYFSSDRGGNYGLYRSSSTGGVFSTPTLISGVDLDSANNEHDPVVSPDELTLYFSSDRPGGLGDFDIYEARRPTVADGFGAPIALTSLNTPSFDVPSWISADGCVLYFTRADGNLGYQLYVATRGS